MAAYCIGDIVWAKIGKLPFWPSIVCADPKLDKHIRNDKNKIALHVRFFNDKGRRCWVINFKKYHAEKDDLVPLNPHILQSRKKIPKTTQHIWENAVKEAYRFQQLNRAVRISIFSRKYNIAHEKLLMKNVDVCTDVHSDIKNCHVVLNKKEIEDQLKNNNIFLPEQLDCQNWKPKTNGKELKESIPKVYYNFEKGFNHVP